MLERFKRRSKSKFVNRLNTLMGIYETSMDTRATYKELLKLEILVKTQGERALYDLNRASLLYDLKHYREASDIILEIPSLNPEFDAKCAIIKTKIMDAL